MESYHYPYAAVERAMKIQEVILRTMEGRLEYYQAAEILGISDRQMRKLESSCISIGAMTG